MLGFILVSIGLIIIPGPNVLVIVATSIAHGKRRGLQTVAGTSAAMIIQLLVAAIGTGWFVSTVAQGFYWLKWVGVVYLVYLGVMQFVAMRRPQTNTISAVGSFQRGFWVSLTNPKTILFFSAFIPQFVSSAEHYFWQVAMLSAVFWLLAVCLDSCYAILSHKAAALLKVRSLGRVGGGITGSLYIGAGAALASVKNTP